MGGCIGKPSASYDHRYTDEGRYSAPEAEAHHAPQSPRRSEGHLGELREVGRNSPVRAQFAPSGDDAYHQHATFSPADYHQEGQYSYHPSESPYDSSSAAYHAELSGSFEALDIGRTWATGEASSPLRGRLSGSTSPGSSATTEALERVGQIKQHRAVCRSGARCRTMEGAVASGDPSHGDGANARRRRRSRSRAGGHADRRCRRGFARLSAGIAPGAVRVRLRAWVRAGGLLSVPGAISWRLPSRS